MESQSLAHLTPMRNGLEIIKGISGCIEYQKECCEQDTRSPFVWDTHEQLIVYWDCIWSAVQRVSVNTHLISTQGFWPQSQVTIVESSNVFSTNKDVREGFTSYEHYVGSTRNHATSSFHVAKYCYKGYMALTCTREEHLKNQFVGEKHRCHPIV